MITFIIILKGDKSMFHIKISLITKCESNIFKIVYVPLKTEPRQGQRIKINNYYFKKQNRMFLLISIP